MSASGFPYYDTVVGLREVREAFAELEARPAARMTAAELKAVGKFVPKARRLAPLAGERSPLVVATDYEGDKRVNRITAFFSDRCRMECHKHDLPCPRQFFEDNRGPGQLFEGADSMTYDQVMDALTWKNPRRVRVCELFKAAVVRQVYLRFCPEGLAPADMRVLDFSAGWGDRMVAALSLGADYTGVDPSECMAPVYKRIARELGGGAAQARVLRKGFETATAADLPSNSFDVVFSSPPFFKLETYEAGNAAQSVRKFDTPGAWAEGFLRPVVRTSFRCLRRGAYFCVNLEDYTDRSGGGRPRKTAYVAALERYAREAGFGESEGSMYWVIKYGGGEHKATQGWDPKSTPSRVRVWRKPSAFLAALRELRASHRAAYGRLMAKFGAIPGLDAAVGAARTEAGLERAIKKAVGREAAGSSAGSSAAFLPKSFYAPLEAGLPAAPRYLDLGAGSGHKTRLLSRELGVEAADTVCLEKEGTGFDVIEDTSRAVCDLRTYAGVAMPFEDASFDLVSAFHVLHHVEDVRATVRELARVLRPGGFAVVQDHDVASAETEHYVRALHFLYACQNGEDLSRLEPGVYHTAGALEAMFAEAGLAPVKTYQRKKTDQRTFFALFRKTGGTVGGGASPPAESSSSSSSSSSGAASARAGLWGQYRAAADDYYAEETEAGRATQTRRMKAVLQDVRRGAPVRRK
jgi:SAM-dependent methyltransferase